MEQTVITTEHGSGGAATAALIDGIFAKAFDNLVLAQMEDSAVVPGAGEIAVTTDSFVVDPLFFNGGDIGRLSVCGTVNDLLMRGAEPKYLTCGFILETGLLFEELKRIAASMAATAKEAGVTIVAGDTKVVEGGGGLYINTAGVGFAQGREIGARQIQPGDVIILSGNLGEHHAAILSERLSIDTDIASDCAPLVEMVRALMTSDVAVHAMRDITRGGLATILKEMAETSGLTFELKESCLPVTPKVRDFCGLLGLDPLYMGNEGKMAVMVPESDADEALRLIRASAYGAHAAVVGRVSAGEPGQVVVETAVGGRRNIDVLRGEGLPRIC